MESNNFDVSKVSLIEKPVRDPAVEFLKSFNDDDESPWDQFWFKVRKWWWSVKYKIRYRGKEAVMKEIE